MAIVRHRSTELGNLILEFSAGLIRVSNWFNGIIIFGVYYERCQCLLGIQNGDLRHVNSDILTPAGEAALDPEVSKKFCEICTLAAKAVIRHEPEILKQAWKEQRRIELTKKERRLRDLSNEVEQIKRDISGLKELIET